MRIHPLPTATGAPGVGNTYTIPAGNLFPAGHRATRGPRSTRWASATRSGSRSIRDTGWVLIGDYGPDAGATEPEPRPAGQRRVQRDRGARQLRLALLRPRQRPVQRLQLRQPAQSGPKFNCDAPVNNSPNNTGLTNLPPAKPATMWEGYTETDPRVPGPGHGRRADGRPALPLRPEPRQPDQVPGVLRRASGSSASGTTAGSRRDARRPAATPTERVPDPVPRTDTVASGRTMTRLRSRRLAVRDRVGLRLQRQQRRTRASTGSTTRPGDARRSRTRRRRRTTARRR